MTETCTDLLDVREQVGLVLGALATDPSIPGIPVLAIDGKLFKRHLDGYAEPTGDTTQADGFYYQTATNLIAVIPPFDPNADTEKMSDEQFSAHQNSAKLLGNLLQTLDAAPMAVTNGFGAVVYGDKLFFRGGDDDAMISTNAPAKVDAAVVGWYKDGAFTALVSDYATKNVKELGDSTCSITETMVAAVLKRLAEAGHARAVYVAHGQVWELKSDGSLSAKVAKVAEPVSWAVGHDVRPARMARGARPSKCNDCHTVGSTFFFAKVTSTGPLLTARQLVKMQHDFMGPQRQLQQGLRHHLPDASVLQGLPLDGLCDLDVGHGGLCGSGGAGGARQGRHPVRQAVRTADGDDRPRHGDYSGTRQRLPVSPPDCGWASI